MSRESFKAKYPAVTQADFEAFVGPTAYKFEKTRQALLAGSNRGEFDWLAFLFAGFYPAYYKMWGLILGLYGGFTALYIFLPHFSGNIGMSTAIGVMIGRMFRTLYVQHAYKKIQTIKERSGHDSPVQAILMEKQGGTSIMQLLFSIFILFALIFTAVLFTKIHNDLHTQTAAHQHF